MRGLVHPSLQTRDVCHVESDRGMALSLPALSGHLSSSQGFSVTIPVPTGFYSSRIPYALDCFLPQCDQPVERSFSR